MAKRIATGHLPSQRQREIPKEEIVKKEPLKLTGRYMERGGTKYAFAYDKKRGAYEYGEIRPIGQNSVFMPVKEKQIRVMMIFGALKYRNP